MMETLMSASDSYVLPISGPTVFNHFSFSLYFKLEYLGWITEEELEEALSDADEYKNLSKLDKDLFKDERKALAKYEIDTLCIKRYKESSDKLMSRVSIFSKTLRHSTDKPEVSGQPRRFTKAFIPWFAMLLAYRSVIGINKLKNISEVENWVNVNCSKLDILCSVFVILVSYLEYPDCSWSGVGKYDSWDAYYLTNYIGSSLKDAYDMFGVTDAEIGIQF